MGNASGPPPAPSAGDVSKKQQDYNITAAAAGQAGSMVGQETPFGSLSYQKTGTGPGGIPLYTATTNLTPQMQAIVNSLQGITSGNLGGPTDYSAGNFGQVVGDATSGLTSNLLQKQMDYYQPYFKKDKAQLDTTLRNQGFAPGQPGYDNAMRGLLDSQNRTMQQAAATFEPQAYNQAVQNYLGPLSVANTVYGMINPAFAKSSMVPTPTTSVQPVDYSSNAWNQYNAQLQQSQAAQSGMWGIPTALLGGWAQSGFALPSFGGSGLSAALAAPLF